MLNLLIVGGLVPRALDGARGSDLAVLGTWIGVESSKHSLSLMGLGRLASELSPAPPWLVVARKGKDKRGKKNRFFYPEFVASSFSFI